MKSWTMIAGCGAAMLIILVTACGGEESKKQAPAPESAAPAKAMPAAKPGQAAAQPAPFSPEMSAEFMRKVMETTARIEAVKKEIAERQNIIFETNPEVKAYRTKLIEMQKEIGKILDADAELAALKLNRDILWTTMPTLPRGNMQGGGGQGFGPMKKATTP